MKYFTTKDLLARLQEENLVKTKATIIHREKKGLLRFRRSPVHNWRMITEEDIEGIVKAWSPGGKGKWSYDGK